MKTKVTCYMIETAQAAYLKADSEYRDACSKKDPSRYKLLRVFDALAADLRRLQSRARNELAEERGWRVSTRWRGLVRFAHPYIDHSELFLMPANGKAVVLSHSYAEWPELKAFGARHLFKVERLDWSWYYPKRCIAVLFYMERMRMGSILHPRSLPQHDDYVQYET